MSTRLLLAPASLKGVLRAVEAAELLAVGVARVAGTTADVLPIADGGEGTAEVIARARGGTWHEATVPDPIGRSVRARFLLLGDGQAIVECAEAIGLDRLAPAERDPLRASSAGFGALLLAALEAGATSLLAGLGGSATVDGGAGLRAVVGDRLERVPVTVACDVSNPLLGERGAARVFGPQKGADAAAVVELERRLAARRELRPFADLPGAGAAGGLGAALAALGAELVPGAELVLRTLGAPDAVRAAQLVVTGEGTVDRTSGEGKAPGTLARLCRAAGVRCVVFGGVVVEPPSDLEVMALSGDPARATDDLVALGEALAREAVSDATRRRPGRDTI